MGTDTSPPESSEGVSQGSPFSPPHSYSPLAVLSTVLLSLAVIAAIVFMSARHLLDDTPGWAKLAALTFASVAASERAHILALAVQGWFRRK